MSIDTSTRVGTEQSTERPADGFAGAGRQRAGIGGTGIGGTGIGGTGVPIAGLPRYTRLEIAALTDDALEELLRSSAEWRRQVDEVSGMAGAEIAERSKRELGYQGLAQRRGSRTPELLVQQITGVSIGDARTLISAGTIVASLEPDSPVESVTPWLAAGALGIREHTLSLAQLASIRAGLGEPTQGITVHQLALAADQLVLEAPTMTLEWLSRRARDLRNQLDETGIADREEHLRTQRFLKLTPLPDGMTRISGLLDPESAAIVIGAVDAVTSPRRGGPRFLDPDEKLRAQTLHDGRTLGQLTLDALVDIVQVASLAGEKKVLGAKRVAVRVIVTAADLQRRAGAGHIEGQTEAISINTIERHICETGFVEALFNSDGQALNLGREQRLYTPRQRTLLAIRDGGCRFPNCSRPPSWTEAHHINAWQHGGKTDVADGILLCKHHHMLVHNNHWAIERDRATYTAVSPNGQRINMPSKSPITLGN
jgi:hypothetical protein